MFSLAQGEGTFKVHENQSWQLSKPLLIVLCVMQNVEESISALYQEGELGEGQEWEKDQKEAVAEGSKSLKVTLYSL